MTGAFLLLSCDFMYDDPEEAETIATDGSFRYIDATSYTDWVYVDLASHTATKVAYDNEDDIPEEWHFALHRYNCKTHGGAVLETAYTSLAAFRKDLQGGAFSPADGTYTADTADQIAVNMEQMMQGIVGYAASDVNEVLSRWMTLDTTVMPPAYETSGKVYVIRMADGTYAAVLFTDYMNAAGATGHISFDYLYPLTEE